MRDEKFEIKTRFNDSFYFYKKFQDALCVNFEDSVWLWLSLIAVSRVLIN